MSQLKEWWDSLPLDQQKVVCLATGILWFGRNLYGVEIKPEDALQMAHSVIDGVPANKKERL